MKSVLKLFRRVKSNFKSLTGTGKDDLGITRTFGISEQSNGKYALADYTRGQGIETYDVNYRDITFEEKYYPGILTTSTSTTFNDPKAVSAHFLATNVYDFYKDKYKRNSFDNKGKKVVSVVHAWDSGETNDPKNWGMHLALILTMLVCLYMVIQWLDRLT